MATTDHLQQRIRFFEISAEAKENIAKSESERIRLEIELNRLVNSEDAVTKSKAQKLKIYYEKLCEDESKSQRRNQQLLSDLKRIDSNFQELETKLERLTHVKKEMETYFKTAHPKWTTDNKLFEPVGFGMGSATFRGGAPRQETNYDEKTSTRTINSLMEALRPKKDSTHIMDNQSLNQAQSGPSSPSKHSHSTIASMVVLPSSNLPKSPPRAAARVGLEPEIPNKGSTPQSPQSRQLNVDREPVNQFVNNLVLSAAGAAADVRPGTSKDAEQTMLLQSGTMNQAESNLLKAYEQDIKRRDDDFNASSSLNQLMLASNEYNREVEPDNSNIRLASQLNMWKDDANKTENINNGSPLRQELNVAGFFHLLDFIEQEISYAIRPENFYRQVEPHYKNKLEIIKLAREGKPLNQTDPADASMVVLDQLPIVIEKHTKNKCLFTRDLLGLSVADISEQLVLKSLRDESDKRLWKRLVKHWSTLVRGSNKLSAAMLARLFAVALIGQANAGASEKAVKFLEKIINEAGLEGSGPLTERSITETSINQELLLASSSKLKESSVYQDFIQNTQSSGKLKVTKNVEPDDYDDDDDNDDDENDDIDAMVAPKSLMSAGSAGKLKNQGQILKSPRANDYDFEFSQNSVTETSQKAPKVLHSLRSSGDKDKLPVHLRNLDSDDESETTSYEASARSKKSKGQKSDGDYDFYQ